MYLLFYRQVKICSVPLHDSLWISGFLIRNADIKEQIRQMGLKRREHSLQMSTFYFINIWIISFYGLSLTNFWENILILCATENSIYGRFQGKKLDIFKIVMLQLCLVSPYISFCINWRVSNSKCGYQEKIWLLEQIGSHILTFY